MDPNKLNAWVLVVTSILGASATVAADVRRLLGQNALTDAEQNAVLDTLLDSNRRHRAISQAVVDALTANAQLG